MREFHTCEAKPALLRMKSFFAVLKKLVLKTLVDQTEVFLKNVIKIRDEKLPK